MRLILINIHGLILFLSQAQLLNAEKHILFDQKFDQFLSTYCIECHGPDKDKGDRVFHQLAITSTKGKVIDTQDQNKVTLLKEILDQLNLGEMPPDKKGVKQPPIDIIKYTRDWLSNTLNSIEQFSSKSETPLKRLTKSEYRHTMETLLGLSHLSFDPSDQIPNDEQHHGFDNIAEQLSLSDSHMNQWLDAAETYLDLALHFGSLPKTKKIVITPKMWGFPDKEPRTPWMYRIRTEDYVDIGAGEKQLSDHIGLASVPQALKKGVQISGYYDIVIEAEAVRRLTHPYDPIMIPANLQQPMQLSLYIAPQSEGLVAGGKVFRKKVALWDLEDHKKKIFKTRVWLNRGSIPFLNWDNGPGPSDWWMRDICKTYHTDIEFKGKEGAHAWHIIGKNLVPGRMVSDVWKGPVMRIHHLSLNGPLQISFHSRAQKDFFDNQHDSQKINIKESITRFTREAFRRDVSFKEIEPYIELAMHSHQHLKLSKDEAVKMAFKAVLVSPEFLYHSKKVLEDGRLDSTSIANRLAYTLWSCPPDSILIKKASESNLQDPVVLKTQVSRMLNDPKSKQFIKQFTTAWLRLDKLGVMPPSRSKYLNYYGEGLEELIKEETLIFIEYLLKENLPITTLINADFSFINQSLASHYGSPPIEGSYFRKVHFKNQPYRGGLLGQASILTLTANGVDTSPVTRGIWILESILGTPPPPPPPDVEPLDPDIRGAKTLKERLSKHRKVETCADCHAKIDPYGFAMENFNPIGELINYYPKKVWWSEQKKTKHILNGLVVDSSAMLPDGTNIKDLSELKKVLFQKRKSISKMLTEKLLTYATGRELNYRDQQEIERIAFKKDAEHYGFRDLITEALSSKLITQP